MFLIQMTKMLQKHLWCKLTLFLIQHANVDFLFSPSLLSFLCLAIFQSKAMTMIIATRNNRVLQWKKGKSPEEQSSNSDWMQAYFDWHWGLIKSSSNYKSKQSSTKKRPLVWKSWYEHALFFCLSFISKNLKLFLMSSGFYHPIPLTTAISFPVYGTTK